MSNKKKAVMLILVAILLAGVIIIHFLCIGQKKSLTYEDKVTGFASENMGLKKGQIVFLGDSITAGYKLNLHYYDSPLETYNRGISGDTTDWMLARMQVSLFDIEPSKIVLMIGTNDINANKSAEEIASNYKAILNLILSNLPGAEVICVSIIPQNTKYSKDAAVNNMRIRETNSKIETLAGSYGYEYINLYDNLTDCDGLLKKGYSKDGLHLNFMGYMAWTKAMRDVLY